MAYTNKTLRIPDLTESIAGQTQINPETGMAMDYSAGAINPLATLQASATPIKTSQIQTTTPFAQANMIANRNRVGQATRDLNEALKQREGLGYTLASALSAIPEQQGYGSWLSALGRSFGAGLGARTNAAVDRAQKVYDAQMKDLATLLSYDKSLGDTIRTDFNYKYPNNSDNSMLALSMLFGE